MVGQLARDILSVSDSMRQPLGPDRIEQIYERWYGAKDGLAAEPGGWRRDGGRVPMRPWQHVKKRARPGEGHGLLDARPSLPGGRHGMLEEYVAELLHHGGRWPHPVPRYLGDTALTEKAAERLRSDPVPLLIFPGPEDEEPTNGNGVEK